MLHGHTKIELTNVEDGTTQKVESDNMFTNALNTIFNKHGIEGAYNSSPYEKLLPLSEKGLRGILLFPVTLEESVDDIYPKTAFKAHAGSSTDVGSDVTKGAYNATESGAITNGYRYVWDFTTSQGNGTIASVGLTSDIFGNDTMNTDASTFVGGNRGLSVSGERIDPVPPGSGSSGSNYNYFPNCCVIERTKDYAIIAAPASKSGVNYIGELALIKVRYPLNALRFDSPLNLSFTIQKEIPLNESIEYANAFYHNSLVYLASRKDDTTLYLMKIDLTTETVTKDVITIPNLTKNIRNHNSFYKNGYFYFMRKDATTYYLTKLNLSNYADMTDIVTSTTSDGSMQYIERTKTARISKVGILFEDDTLFESPFIIGKSTLGQDQMNTSEIMINGFFALSFYPYPNSSYSSYIFFDFYETLIAGYLATINNLPSPVTKTAAQTMKITYTVTES